MGYKADSGQKFDQGKIGRVLALVNELTDLEMAQLLTKLRAEIIARGKSHGANEETSQI